MIARRATVAGAALLALAAGAAACFADLASLSAGGPLGPDAGSGLDAMADGNQGPVDAAKPQDVDAADAADAGAGFCATAGAHTYCEDYDDDAGLAPADTFGSTSGAKVFDIFASPPAALAATLPAAPPDGGEVWYLPFIVVPQATKHVHLEAKVQMCSAVGTSFIVLSVNNTTTTNGYGAIDFGVQKVGAAELPFVTIKHEAYSKTFPLGAALPTTRFAHIALDTDLDKTNGTVKIAIDGAVVVDAANLPTDSSGTVTARRAWAGAYGYETPPCTIHVDDVLLDAN